MARLQADLESRVTFVTHKFTDITDVLALNENLIVNCTALGAGALFSDPLVRPLKGQLVFLKTQPNLNYLFSGSHCYVFPRADAVVVGGSQQPLEDDTPDPALCKKILEHAKNVFGGKAFIEAIEDWMINK